MDRVRLKARFPKEAVADALSLLKAEKKLSYHVREDAESALVALKALKFKHEQLNRFRTSTENGGCTRRLRTAVLDAARCYANFVSTAKVEVPELKGLAWSEPETEISSFSDKKETVRHVEALVAGTCKCQDLDGDDACEEPAEWPAAMPEFCSEKCAAKWGMHNLHPPEPSEEEVRKYRSQGVLWATQSFLKSLPLGHSRPEYKGDVEADGFESEDIETDVDELHSALAKLIEERITECPDPQAAERLAEGVAELVGAHTVYDWEDLVLRLEMFMRRKATEVCA